MDCINSTANTLFNCAIGHEDKHKDKLNTKIPSQYLDQLEIYNFTNYNIGVSTRTGKKFGIYKHNQTNISGFAMFPCIHVRTLEVMQSESKNSIAALNTADNLLNNRALDIAVNVWTTVTPGYLGQRNNNNVNVTTQEMIDESVLEKSGQVYHRDLDLVFCLLPDDFVAHEALELIPDHPYSNKTLLANQIEPIKYAIDNVNSVCRASKMPPLTLGGHESTSVFIAGMKLIEGEHSQYGQYYVRTRGLNDQPQVIVLTADKDPRYLPGLYVYSNVPSRRPNDHKRYQIDRYTEIADFERFGVFTTLAQAELSDQLIIAQIEARSRIQKISHEERKLSSDDKKLQDQIIYLEQSTNAQREKHDHEMNLLQEKSKSLEREAMLNEQKHVQSIKELEEKARTAKAENDFLKEKLKSDKEKEVRDKGIHKTKMWHDIIKLVPGLIGGALALILFFKGLIIKVPKPI